MSCRAVYLTNNCSVEFAQIRTNSSSLGIHPNVHVCNVVVKVYIVKAVQIIHETYIE